MVSEISYVEKQNEDEFFSSFVSDDPKYISDLNECYFWIVEYMAAKFSGLGVSTEDIEKEAYYTLLDAACSYKPTEDSRFGLYALPLIKETILNQISDTAMTTLGVETTYDLLIKAKSLSGKVSSNLLNDTTDWEASQALGIDEETLIEMVYGQTSSDSGIDLKEFSKKSLDKIVNAPSKIIQGASDRLNNIIDSISE